ncbi:phage tail tube protein [Clostridium butyricum]|uniref:XkdM protein, phage-like element PBSX n=1 Tax=Clostridium butyricum E4 str. BoNT E BL5262 TaxID=632245 RepID=C4IGR5_CLOBU|nr:phage tail tube protein [Clostridium butyricum]EDT74813.1 putative phage protein [Clostridium butyricum 5521]EEP54444.1 conserved hypothetical protein [Clostridium butyricum E4 str. BoNT E BL5262]NFL30483.1 terminase [Clostridium butyricum]NFS19438.1 terminase [Clostridium butyricum]
MAVNTNQILNGKGGNTWFNNSKLATVKKMNAKVTGDFEDENFCGDPATYTIYNGWGGEGSVTIKPTNSEIWSTLCKAYKDGTMPDIKIVTSLQRNDGKAERVALKNVVFTEFDIVNFEAKTAVEREFPFKFSDFEVLEEIA